MNKKDCNCKLCTNHDLYRWAKIMECKCACHDMDGVIGHDGLCCPYPNGKKKDNPYTELKDANSYHKLMKMG